MPGLPLGPSAAPRLAGTHLEHEAAGGSKGGGQEPQSRARVLLQERLQGLRALLGRGTAPWVCQEREGGGDTGSDAVSGTATGAISDSVTPVTVLVISKNAALRQRVVPSCSVVCIVQINEHVIGEKGQAFPP